jgi:uncharacterized membrane protein YgcG
MEAYLTDAKSRRILERMKPFLKKSLYYEAFVLAIEDIETVIKEAEAESKENSNGPYVKDNKVLIKGEPIDWGSVFSFILGFFVIGIFVFLVIELRRKILYFNTEVAKILKEVRDYKNDVSSITHSVDMKDESEFVDDRGGYLIRKLENLKYNIFSSSEKDKVFIDSKEYLRKISEIYTKADKERVRRNKIRKEEEDRKEMIRKEEEARKKKIRDEADILKKSQLLLSKNYIEQININFDTDKKFFEEKFPGAEFIEKPNYEKAIEGLQEAMKLVKGDGMSLNILSNKFDSLLNALESSKYYIESIKQKRSNLKRDLEKLNQNKSLITNKDLVSTKYRKDLSEEIQKGSKKAEDLYLNNKFDQCQSLLSEVFRKIEILSKKINDEKYLRKYLTDIEKEVVLYSSSKYISGNSSRRSWGENAKTLLDQAKRSLDPDKTEESMRIAKNAMEASLKVKKDYNDEIEEEDRKRKKEAERLRRKREEEEDEDRRRRNSYSSYDYSGSSSSSSWSDSGSSFGGGDSGGGGSSSDF